MKGSRKGTKPIVLKANDRVKVLGNISKPSCDTKCCYTSCTRC